MVQGTQINFTSYLLDDNFGITDARAADVIGNLSTVGTIAGILTVMILGTIMDMFGRKIPSIVGVVIAAIGMTLMPIPKKLSGLYILRCLIEIGVLPLKWSPFVVDYICKQSLGLYSAY